MRAEPRCVTHLLRALSHPVRRRRRSRTVSSPPPSQPVPPPHPAARPTRRIPADRNCRCEQRLTAPHSARARAHKTRQRAAAAAGSAPRPTTAPCVCRGAAVRTSAPGRSQPPPPPPSQAPRVYRWRGAARSAALSRRRHRLRETVSRRRANHAEWVSAILTQRATEWPRLQLLADWTALSERRTVWTVWPVFQLVLAHRHVPPRYSRSCRGPEARRRQPRGPQLVAIADASSRSHVLSTV